MSFGDNVKRLRRDNGWTQAQLADAAGLKMAHIPKLEKDNADPKLSTIYKLTNAFGCSTDTLLMDADKVGTDALLKASLERIQQLPDTHKYILMDIIDAYCIRNGIQAHFKEDHFLKTRWFSDQIESLVKEERVAEAIGTGKQG